MINAAATIRLKFPTKSQLTAVFEALKPETRNPVTERSKVTIRRDDKALTLTLLFEARDTSALRAALNSYLHWIRLTQDALNSLAPSNVNA